MNYLIWHYTYAPGEILVLFRNYAVAYWHRFLIARHLKTLLSPWHRQNPADFSTNPTFSDKVGDFVVDVFIRCVAAVFRTVVILIGLLVEALNFLFFGLLLIVWFLWPIIFIYMIIKGLTLL